MEKDSKIDQRILGLNRLQKDQEIVFKTKHIVPYLGNGTKTAASSSHSHAKAIACRDNCQGGAGLKLGEIRRLCRRLDILEKDTQLMKKLFFGDVEERHELLKEISQYLHAIEEHLRNPTAEGKQQKVTSIINIAKCQNRDDGLPQVLKQEQNIAVVTNRKVNIITLRDPTSQHRNDHRC